MPILPFKITKREEVVIVTILLTTVFFNYCLFTSFLTQLGILLVLLVLVYTSFIFLLREDLIKIEFFTLPVLPTGFTLSFALFFGILPTRWLTRLGFVFTYAFLIYAIALISNIFNVAKHKNIQLLRAGRTIHFFITCFSVFLFTYVVLTFHLLGFVSALLVLIFLFIISYAYIWSFSFGREILARDLLIALSVSLCLAELVLVLSFWPLNIYLTSLLITCVFYSLLGIWDNFLSYRLRGWAYREYIIINLIIFSLCLLTVRFG